MARTCDDPTGNLWADGRVGLDVFLTRSLLLKLLVAAVPARRGDLVAAGRLLRPSDRRGSKSWQVGVVRLAWGDIDALMRCEDGLRAACLAGSYAAALYSRIMRSSSRRATDRLWIWCTRTSIRRSSSSGAHRFRCRTNRDKEGGAGSTSGGRARTWGKDVGWGRLWPAPAPTAKKRSYADFGDLKRQTVFVKPLPTSGRPRVVRENIRRRRQWAPIARPAAPARPHPLLQLLSTRIGFRNLYRWPLQPYYAWPAPQALLARPAGED